MIHTPSDEEFEQIEKLNKGYKLVKEGLKLIKEGIEKQDNEVEMQAYKMAKNFDKIIVRVKKTLERKHVDEEFFNIVDNLKVQPKNKKENKTKAVKKRIIKRKPKGEK